MFRTSVNLDTGDIIEDRKAVRSISKRDLHRPLRPPARLKTVLHYKKGSSLTEKTSKMLEQKRARGPGMRRRTARMYFFSDLSLERLW